MGTPIDSDPSPDDDRTPDLPPLDPRAVRRIEEALDAAAGTAQPTEAGWAEVAGRGERRRAAHRRTQVAVAAAAVLLLIGGVAIAGRRATPTDLGTVGRPAPTTIAPPDGRLDTTGTSTVTIPGPSTVELPGGDTTPPSSVPVTTPPTTNTTTTTAPAPSTTLPAGPPVAVVSDPDPLVQCQGTPGTFRPSVFTTPDGAEQGTDALSTALRTELERGRFDGYPDTGWRLVWSDDTTALFIAGVPPFARTFTMRFADDRWQAGAGGGCGALRIAPPEGAGWATWTIGARPPSDTASFTVFVDDPSCSGTQSAGDRILPPHIDERDDQVIITFTVTPLPPGSYTCIGHAATPYTVTLQQPIGERALFDGGTWPPRLEPSS
jgi:hypothetical protein